MSDKEEKKKAFLARAKKNKANFELHRKLIKEIFESGDEKLVDIFKEHADDTGIIGDFLVLGLMQYAEAYASQSSSQAPTISEGDAKDYLINYQPSGKNDEGVDLYAETEVIAAMELYFKSSPPTSTITDEEKKGFSRLINFLGQNDTTGFREFIEKFLRDKALTPKGEKPKRYWDGFDFACAMLDEMYAKTHPHEYNIADCLKAKVNRLPNDKIRKTSGQPKGNESGWISVEDKDKLPEIGEWVLTGHVKDDWVDRAELSMHGWDNGECEIYPTHHKPLPKPPKTT